MNPVLSPERLAALAAYRILDTPAEADFDGIVRIASHICATPIALVSLVEQDRQWFKARVGIDACETSISQSVCAHGLSRTDPLIIPDLTLDPRTASNTLVTEEPNIRFYAGAPLVTPSGQVIGMLCVIDTVPRPAGLTADQSEMLVALAAQVVGQLELRRHLRQLEAHEQRLRMAQEAGRVGSFEVDVDTGELLVSPMFCELFGVPVQATYAASDIEMLVLPEDRMIHSNDDTRRTGTAQPAVEYRIKRASDGQLRWISRAARFLHDDDGRPVRMLGTVRDVTTRWLMNAEMAHRLKNTLSLVQAIARMTFGTLSDRGPIEQFDQRLRALSGAHDVLLAQQVEGATLEQIADKVFDTLGVRHVADFEGPSVRLGPNTATMVSLLVHELVTNAMKYGAISTLAGRIAIRWRFEGDDLALDWIERGGPPAEQPTRKGFGSNLIRRGLTGGGGVETDYLPEGLTVRMRARAAAMAD